MDITDNNKNLYSNILETPSFFTDLMACYKEHGNKNFVNTMLFIKFSYDVFLQPSISYLKTSISYGGSDIINTLTHDVSYPIKNNICLTYLTHSPNEKVINQENLFFEIFIDGEKLSFNNIDDYANKIKSLFLVINDFDELSRFHDELMNNTINSENFSLNQKFYSFISKKDGKLINGDDEIIENLTEYKHSMLEKLYTSLDLLNKFHYEPLLRKKINNVEKEQYIKKSKKI